MVWEVEVDEDKGMVAIELHFLCRAIIILELVNEEDELLIEDYFCII